MRTKILAAALCALALPACSTIGRLAPEPEAAATAIREGEYRLDPDHAALLFKVKHFGLSTVVGRFNDFDASLSFDEEDPSAATLEAVIEVGSLDVASEEFAEVLLSGNWLNAETHPQASFRSTAIEVTGETTGRLTGDLTLNGVTAPVTLDVVFNGGVRNILTQRYTLGFEATGAFDRADFGIDRFGGMVGDEVVLELHVEFQRQ